ncbi:MAG TPA: terminase large subunit [Puia sp.]|jgi:phage terminase large subunit
MTTGPLFKKLIECLRRIVVCQGGGDAGKTVAILQLFATKAITEPGSILTVDGEDIPNLKAGALRTFQRYVIPDPEIASYLVSYNKTERVYTFKGGSIIEFVSFEDEQDARGSERDYLYINEANSRTYSYFWQLQRKTRKQVFIDYNPTSAFWCHEKLLDRATIEKQFIGQVQLFITDHRHNPFLSQEEHNNYENIGDPELFQVYSRGKTGKVKGLIFAHFKKIEVFPIDIDRIIWGIDYGYTNDPTALVKIGVKQRKRYHHECCYEPGITADRLQEILVLNGYQSDQDIYSEADPNMINQLRVLGLSVYPAIKGPGSLIASISKVKEFECFYTATSVNFEKEINTWKWMIAEDVLTGKKVMTNVPIDGNDHCCAASRYGIYTDSFRGAA